MKLFQTLEIVDVTVVTLPLPESSLAIDRGAVGHVTLTENSRIGLRQWTDENFPTARWSHANNQNKTYCQLASLVVAESRRWTHHKSSQHW